MELSNAFLSPSKVCRSVGVVLTLAIIFTCCGFARCDEAKEPQKAARGASVEPDSAQKADAPVKWLPDLRVLRGAPTTYVELSPIFRQLCEAGYFGEDKKNVSQDDVEWSIALGDGEDSIVDLEIEGSRLAVNWKPDKIGKTEVVVKAALKENEESCAFASFNAESWTPDYMAILAAILGGSGLFLFGMKLLSSGLQAIAGSRLRRLISLFTSNRFLAVGVGVVTTTLVQSSTATSVMALGFVDSGLMTLKQAVGVIIGTNIGTTTTGWLLSLNIGALGLPILGVGALFYIFCKGEKIRNISQFALGLGMIFFGLEVLKNGLRPVTETPEFSAMIQSIEATDMMGVLKCFAVGFVTTVLAHSSAASLAITMTLASLGVIDLNSAAAIALGSNVGTTLTAVVIAIGASANTRRTAWFHVLFNTLGVVWILPIFFIVLIPTINGIGDALNMSLCGRIALTHTIFNVANTIVFLPLIGPVARALERYLPEKTPDTREENSEKRLDDEEEKEFGTGVSSVLERMDGDRVDPLMGVAMSREVVGGMFIDCRSLLKKLIALKKNGYADEGTIEKAFEIERKLDKVQDETIDFISRITPRATTSDFTSSAREQIRIAEELETISDYFAGVLKSNLKLRNDGLVVPQQMSAEMDELGALAKESFEILERNFLRHVHTNIAGPMDSRRATYVKLVKDLRERLIEEMGKQRLEPRIIIAVEYQLNAWRRICEHLQNIAEALEIPAALQTQKRALNAPLKKASA